LRGRAAQAQRYVAFYYGRPIMNVLAFFEVMDKEPSLLMIWIASLLLGIGGLFLSRFKWWLGLIVIGVALVSALAQIQELHDPFVGPVIVREAGYGYVLQSYLASAIAVLMPSIGLVLRWKRSR
jgi:CHASE2 domain-containing sensor protein